MIKRIISAASRGLAIPARIGFNILTRRNYPRLYRTTEWSIGIYRGSSPFDLSDPPDIHNPVMTAAQVTDVKAEFVADPFMIKEGTTWYMFFEVLNMLNGLGEIGMATSDDGYKWTYQSMVLREPFHLSYPLIFKWQDEFYMIPESGAANRIALYKAKKFPYGWEYAATILDGQFTDHVIFRHDDLWWLLSGSDPQISHMLRLFYADHLPGPWQEHIKSPIFTNNTRTTRPAGGAMAGVALATENKIIRYAQDCSTSYGSKVNAFLINQLSKTEYSESAFAGNPILQPGQSTWKMHGMHHINAHEIAPGQWLACVDGYKRKLILEAEY
jgi:beta-xylosidase